MTWAALYHQEFPTDHPQRYHYQGYGLHIVSDIALPWPVVQSNNEQPDISIHYGTVPEAIESATDILGYQQVAAGVYLLNVAGIIRCLIAQEGRQVLVDQKSGHSDAIIYILDSILAICMHLRGMTALRASAIATSQGAIVFMGRIGAGKSTLVAALGDLGYPLVADGIVGIQQTKEACPQVSGGFPTIHLWKKALDILQPSWRENIGSPMRPELENYPVFAQRFQDREIPVHVVCELTRKNNGAITFNLFTPAQAFAALMRHTCRVRLLHGLGQEVQHFHNATCVVQHATLERLSCPPACSPVALAKHLSERLPPPA